MLKKKLHQSQLGVLVDEVTRTQSTLLSEQTSIAVRSLYTNDDIIHRCLMISDHHD